MHAEPQEEAAATAMQTDASAVDEQQSTSEAVAASATVAAPSASKSKAQRKKANRKANKRAATALVTSLLTECNALTHATVFSPSWFRGFQRYKRVYRVYYLAASDLAEGCLEWIFLLTKLNMQAMYQRTKGWGWNDKEKREESTHPDARYFIITQTTEEEGAAAPAAASSSAAPSDEVDFIGEPVAFCHMRFTTGDQDQAPVAYVYELQLEASVQRQGLGRFLMSLVELVAWRCQMRRVILTVFRSNKAASRFYSHTLNYTLDDTDPELWEQDVDYQILAKRNKKVATIADITLPIVTPAAATAPSAATTDSALPLVANGSATT